MRGYFGLGQLSATEKSDILNQHKSVYNGYQTMQPQVSNTQPLTVYDFAGDKEGLVVNNKGEVKKYTNMGINEQIKLKEVCDDCGAMIMDGVCNECGYGRMDEKFDFEDIEFDDFDKHEKEFRPGVDFGKSFEKMKKKDSDDDIESFFKNKLKTKFHELDEMTGVCECGGEMREGVCNECGYQMEELDERTGHLDDIYSVRDLNLKNGEFDYVEGGGNDYGTFEKMHHMKNIKSEQIEDNFEDPDNEDDGFEDINSSEVTDGELDELGTHKLEKGRKYKYHTPSFEDEIEFDDEFEDKEGGDKMYKFKGKQALNHLMAGKSVEKFVDYLDEQGYTGGGNAPDMDLSNIEPAYDFISDGPGDVYPTEGEVEESECDECWEKMESAWNDELDETDISGVQGIYGDMEPAYDFDSEGPGKAGPYQRFSFESENDDDYWEKDLEDGELDFDLEKFNPEDKSWEEIKAHTNNWDEIDEDLQESFVQQKDKIMEMFNRFRKYN